MSLVKSKAIQLGFDATPTNNFLIYQPLTPDGTFRIANGNQGATTDIMTVTSGGSVTFAGTTNFSSLNFGAGSESAPSLFPTGDSNTGIWFPAADTFAVSTGGAQRLRITSGGSVGINTPSPSGIFHVSQASGSMYIDVAGGVPRMRLGGGNGFGFNRISASEDIFFGEPGDTGTWRVRGAGGISLGVGNTGTTMTIAGNDGNVTIGSISSYAKLSIGGSVLIETSSGNIPNILFGSPGLNYGQIQNDSTGVWSLGYGATNAAKGTSVLSWNTSGNVGVGTTAPKSTLTVYKNDNTIGLGSSCALNIWNSNGSYSGSGGFINFFSDSRGNYQTASIGGVLNSSTTTGATGWLAFYTKGQESDALPTERMRISPTGNVGINNTSPAVPLDVSGAIRANQITAGTTGGNYVIREIEQFSFGAGGITDEYMLLSPNPSGMSDAYQIMGEFYSSRGSQASGNSVAIDEIMYSRAYSLLTANISARAGATYTMFREIVSCTYGGNPWIAVKVRNDGGEAHNGIFFRGWIVGESVNTFKRVRASSLSSISTIRQGQGVQPHFQSGGVSGVSNNFTIYLDQPGIMWKKAIVKMRGRHDGGNANGWMSTGISGVGGVNLERICTTNLCDGTSTTTDTGGGSTWVKLNAGAIKINNGIDWQGTFTLSNATANRPTIDFVFVYTHDAVGVSKTTGAASYAGGAGTVWNYINFDWDLASGTQNMWADWTVEYVY